ncbi:NirD/YgiW/YdeI family stress tolerance protein [bacterium]|nr:NirD/YgiW/YdeI family stress tolerance protein [bacterium]
MKKLQSMFIITVSCLILGSSVMAGDKNKKMGGFVFQPTSITVETVENMKDKKDDEIVVLQGVIEKAIGDEKYLFNDGTGTIIIEIDDDDFKGMTVNANEKVQITGEFDKGGWFKKDKVEVKNIKKLNN